VPGWVNIPCYHHDGKDITLYTPSTAIMFNTLTNSSVLVYPSCQCPGCAGAEIVEGIGALQTIETGADSVIGPTFHLVVGGTAQSDGTRRSASHGQH